MKTIKIPLYTFSELEKEAQRNAKKHHRDINTNYRWWESDYEDFITICKTIGIYIDPKDIYFRGFYSQGDGSCFGSKIEVSEFIKGISEKSWKSYASTFNPNVELCPIDSRIINLIAKGVIEVDMWTETSHRYYFVHYHSQNYLYQKSNRDYIRIEEELEKLDKWAKKTLERLNDCFYKSLENTYEYLISDKAVKETIIANEYLFTKDGRTADRLLNLNIETSNNN